MGEGTSVNYVMIPVPEELAPKVLNYVNWKGSLQLQKQLEDAASAEGDVASPAVGSDPVGRVFARLDGPSRELLVVAAQAALAGDELTVPSAARRAGLTERETIGVITEVNNLVAGEGGPMITVLVKRQEGADDAAFTWHTRCVMMQDAPAQVVDALARASTG
jgi:hypothetical protein